MQCYCWLLCSETLDLQEVRFVIKAFWSHLHSQQGSPDEKQYFSWSHCVLITKKSHSHADADFNKSIWHMVNEVSKILIAT